MADSQVIQRFFSAVGDHVADFADGQDEQGRKHRGRKRRDKDATAPAPADDRVGSVKIEKDLPFLRELLKFITNNTPGAWVTPVDGVQVLLPKRFAPVFDLVQGNWQVDLSNSVIELKIRKTVLGLTVSYPTGLIGVAVTTVGALIKLKNCPDFILSPTAAK